MFMTFEEVLAYLLKRENHRCTLAELVGMLGAEQIEEFQDWLYLQKYDGYSIYLCPLQEAYDEDHAAWDAVIVYEALILVTREQIVAHLQTIRDARVIDAHQIDVFQEWVCNQMLGAQKAGKFYAVGGDGSSGGSGKVVRNPIPITEPLEY